MLYVIDTILISSLDSKPAFWNSLVPRKTLFFRALGSKKVMKDFAKINGRTCPLNLGPRILKIVVFGGRRRLLHPHFGLGSYEMKKNFAFFNSKAKESHEGLRKKTNGRTYPLNLGSKDSKMLVFVRAQYP